MIKVIDRYIENKFLHAMHKKKDKYIKKTVAEFKKKYPDENEEVLMNKLHEEIDRIFALADQIVIKEKIKLAKYAFWITSIIGILLVAAVSAFSFGSLLPFVSPLIAALASYAFSLASIPFCYRNQIRGSIDAILLDHEKTISSRSSSSSDLDEVQVPTDNSHLEILKLLAENKSNNIVIHIYPKNDAHAAIEIDEREAANTYYFNHAALFKSAVNSEIELPQTRLRRVNKLKMD